MIDSGRGNTRAEDAHGTPTQRHIPPSILENEDSRTPRLDLRMHADVEAANFPFFFEIGCVY